jgi:hypothetical protein
LSKNRKRTDWTPEDVKEILFNPIYAYGIWMEPKKDLSEWMSALSAALPIEFWEQPVEKKSELYSVFFTWLQQNRFVLKIRDDAPTMIDVETWLAVQQKLLDEPGHIDPIKLEAVRGFLGAALTDEQ